MARNDSFQTATNPSASKMCKYEYGTHVGIRVQRILVKHMAEALGYPLEAGFIDFHGRTLNPNHLWDHDLRRLEEDETKAISMLTETFFHVKTVNNLLGHRLRICLNKAETNYEAMYVVNGLYNETKDIDDFVEKEFKDFCTKQDYQPLANELATLLVLHGGAL